MSIKPILVFPAGMPGALDFLECALADGQSIIGASSLPYDPARKRYPEWVYLPYVTDPDFDEVLRCVVAEYDIDGIFTPNPIVWDYLDRSMRETLSAVRLVNPSPARRAVMPYRRAVEFAQTTLSEPLALAASGAVRPMPSALEIAALFHHANNIPGQCDDEKIRALVCLFCHMPEGDVVEIGSLWGKSAFVLAWLAHRYGVGHMLCVDPWSTEYTTQNDEKGLVDRLSENFPIEETFSIFQINLLPYANGNMNYLRLPSVEAATMYRRNRQVVTDAFGTTAYCGKIALLHIDGNHAYENAHADIAAWSELVVQDGWIVMDDYRWPYGDGPKRASDEFLQDTNISCAFVMGGALFLQLAR